MFWGEGLFVMPLTLLYTAGVYRVFSGKLVTSGLWDKIGVSWDEVQEGKNAGIDSTLHDFTPEQHARFDHRRVQRGFGRPQLRRHSLRYKNFVHDQSP